MNPYIPIVLHLIPRILTNLDRDRDSPTFGCFDRNFWHYKVHDYSSGLLQQCMLTLGLVYSNNFEGNINISLLSAKTTIQTPLGSFGSLSGSYRRTYLDVFASKISDEFPDYYFYDGNIKAFLDLSDKDKLSISFYGGKDDLSYKFDKKNSDSPEINYIWGNRTTSLNYRKILNNDLFANLWVTYSNFNSKFDFNELDIDEKNVIDDVTGKIILEYNYTDNMKFNIGFENKYMYGLYKQKFRGGKVEFNGHKNYFITYFTTQTHLIDDLIMDIGIRYEQFNSDKIYREINPRLSLKN